MRLPLVQERDRNSFRNKQKAHFKVLDDMKGFDMLYDDVYSCISDIVLIAPRDQIDDKWAKLTM